MAPSDDYDSPWKDVLERAFPEFMAFYFPAAQAQIDWARGYDFHDTELRQVVRDAELGRRLFDQQNVRIGFGVIRFNRRGGAGATEPTNQDVAFFIPRFNAIQTCHVCYSGNR